MSGATILILVRVAVAVLLLLFVWWIEYRKTGPSATVRTVERKKGKL